jgi:chromosomal replication initiator protein
VQQEMAKNSWERILAAIQRKITDHSYKTWFRPTRFLSEDDQAISVGVPNAWFAEWLRTSYGPLIEQTLEEVGAPGRALRFIAEERRPPVPAPAPAAAANPRPAEGVRLGSPLNGRYQFSSFVVSSCNRFAHAAALAVAEQPRRAYNPLYVYGGVGLGKTHLMQAIGNRVAEGGRLRMCYMSSEQFMNELINAIRFEKTLEFKERFRNVDLLMIDDIQFLAGKERTQEEFFHTFNRLYDDDKQIVLTSDVPPRDIPTLEERLRSRFEWGLIADLQPPDLETKIAILRKKGEAEQTTLPDDVALFIASSCKSNIRELEGALIRVIAYASMHAKPLGVEVARSALKDLIAAPAGTTTAESIQKLVANHYNLKVSELKSKTNCQQVAFPRQVAMYLCKQLTDSSLQDIGRKFGGKHHTTVIHALNKIDRKRKEDTDFDKVVERFVAVLK